MEQLDVDLIVRTAKSIYDYGGPSLDVWKIIEKSEEGAKISTVEINQLLGFIYSHRVTGIKPKSSKQLKDEIFQQIGVKCSPGSTLSKGDLIEIHKHIVLSR